MEAVRAALACLVVPPDLQVQDSLKDLTHCGVEGSVRTNSLSLGWYPDGIDQRWHAWWSLLTCRWKRSGNLQALRIS